MVLTMCRFINFNLTSDTSSIMSESSSITPESLKTTLVEKLEATHVEIEDISGNAVLVVS